MMLTIPSNIQYSQIETIFQMTHISASQQRRKVQLNFATASRTSGNCVIKMVSRFLFDAFRVDYFRVGLVSSDDSIKGSNKVIHYVLRARKSFRVDSRDQTYIFKSKIP